MGDVFNRCLGGVDALQPGEYTTVGFHDQVRAKCALRCKECGSVDWLDVTQEVSPDGRIIERWQCPDITCPAVGYVTLESWTP